MVMEAANIQGQAVTAAPSGAAISGDYLSVLTRRAWTIILPFLVCTALGGVVARLVPKQYFGSVALEVIDRTALDQFFKQVDLTLPHKPYLTTIAEVVRTRNFLSDLITECGVHEGFDLSTPKERAALLDRVRKNIDVKMVEQKTGSDLVEFRYTGRDASTVVRFVNAIASKYQKTVMDRYLSEMRIPRENLGKRRNEARRRWEEATAAYERFQVEEDFPSVGDKTLVNRRKDLADSVNALEAAELALKGKEETLERLSLLLRGENESVPGKVTQKKNLAWDRQKAVVETAEDALQKAAEKWLPTAPKVTKLQAELEIERERLSKIPEFVDDVRETEPNKKFTDLDTQRAKLESDIKGDEAMIAKLKKNIEALQVLVKRLPEVLRKEEQLRMAKVDAFGDYDKLNNVFQQVDGTWNRINSPDGEFFSQLRIPVEEEARNWDPVFPNVALFIGIGAFVGILIGAGIAFVAEYGSRSFITVNQVRRTLPVPLLGQVSRIRDARAENRRRFALRFVWMLVAVGVLAAVLIHVCWFMKGLRTNLPPWLFDLLTKVYGQ